MRHSLLASSLVASLATSSAAFADSSEGERLFREGLDVMNEAQASGSSAQLDRACALFEQSFAAEKVVTPLLNLARCEEARGKKRRALQLWRQAAEIARVGGEAATQELAQGAAKGIEDKLPKLRVRASGASTVELDGERIPTEELVPVDRGSHELRASGGGRTETKVVVAQEGIVEVSLLAAPAARRAPPRESSGLALPGWIVLGAGGAAWIGVIATSIVYVTRCEQPLACPENDFGDGLAEANLALWIAAPVLTGVGASLVLVDGMQHRSARGPAVTARAWSGVGAGGLSVQGKF